MSPVAAPADKRFRRAHVKPARRRRWRAFVRPLVRYGLLGSLAVYCLYRGGMVVAHARALQISTITVRGNVQLPGGVVTDALRGLEGQNILWSDLAVWRERLLGSPWIKDAALRRVLPSTIEVVVRERQPVGLGRIQGELYLVDDQGIIDAFGPGYEKYDLPIIDGLSSASEPEGGVDRARAELASRLITAVGSSPEIADRLSQIDVSDPRNASVLLSGDPTLLYVGTDRFLTRLQSYLQLEETMRARVEHIDSVDLRFDDRIYVRPVGRPGRDLPVRMLDQAAPPGPPAAKKR